MKIVVLDGYATNPGDLSWDGLSEFGELTVYDRTPAELTLERAAGAEILISNKVFIGEVEMTALPALRYVGIQATGVNVVDLEAARKCGVAVTNVPAYGTNSVAQHAFALLLEMDRLGPVRTDLWRVGRDLNVTFFVQTEKSRTVINDAKRQIHAALKGTFNTVCVNVVVSEKKIEQFDGEDLTRSPQRQVDLSV